MTDAGAHFAQKDRLESSGESGALKEAFKLAWRCWPYYRPQAKHLGAFVVINSILGALLLVAAIIGALAAVGGLQLAYGLDTPTGPTIVCLAAILFALTHVGGLIRSWVTGQ